MAKQPGVWGIDLGQCALKAIRLENVGGTVTATAFEHIEHPKILSQPDADPEELAREALQKFLSRNNIRGDTIAISIPGQQGLARFVKLPPVEEKKINDIVKFEAKQQIPFPLEEVVWDFQKIGSGIVADGFAMETEIGLFAIKRETVLKTLEQYQSVGIDVHIVQLAPLSLCNFIAYDLLKKEGLPEAGEAPAGKKKCVVALDIGVESSNLVVTDGERIVWQRPIPIGGNRFTRALTKEMKLTYAKAEHLKRNASKSPQLKNILMAMRADLAEFVNEVQKSLAYFTSSQKDAQIQYLVGLGNAFKLPGLQKYLNEKLQLEVKRLPKFLRMAGDAVTTSQLFNENIMTMGTAYGLALQGLKLSRLQTNLLPQDIRMERLVKAKKPWAVSAAACLLLGTGVLAFGYKMQHDAAASPDISRAREDIGKKALANINAWKAKCDARENANKELEKAVGSIVAGQKERINWLRLNRFLNDCLPRADGANLTDKQKAEYWDKGQLAYKAALGKQPGSDGDLVQLHLESVNALYGDDLVPYFERLKDQCKRDDKVVLDSWPEALDPTKPPAGPGWVVELRGYTNHHAERQFVVDTLVANLVSKAKELAKNQDPVAANLSHVVLYRFYPDPNPVGPQFHLINTSDLRFLVTGITPQQAGRPVSPQPSLTGQPVNTSPAAKVDVARQGWSPLGKVAGEPAARTALGTTGFKPPEEKDKKERKELRRTEFVVLFVWREPVSDLSPPSAPAPVVLQKK